MIARLDRARAWTGLAHIAGPIDFARGNAGQADARSLGAPDRTIAVPHTRRRADELSASWDRAQS